MSFTPSSAAAGAFSTWFRPARSSNWTMPPAPCSIELAAGEASRTRNSSRDLTARGLSRGRRKRTDRRADAGRASSSSGTPPARAAAEPARGFPAADAGAEPHQPVQPLLPVLLRVRRGQSRDARGQAEVHGFRDGPGVAWTFCWSNRRARSAVHITFFGGETLMNFPLLKQVVGLRQRARRGAGPRPSISASPPTPRC